MEEDWFTLVPEAARNIKQNKSRISRNYKFRNARHQFYFPDKGDFLASFSRNVPGDQIIADTFRRNFMNTEETKKKFRFENFMMEHMDSEMSNLSVIADHMNLLRSDHSQFWVVNNKEYFASLPAILLSDIGQSDHRIVEIIRV